MTKMEKSQNVRAKSAFTPILIETFSSLDPWVLKFTNNFCLAVNRLTKENSQNQAWKALFEVLSSKLFSCISALILFLILFPCLVYV